MRAIPTLAIALSGALAACQPEAPEGPRPALVEGQYGLVVLTHDFGAPGVAVSAQWMVYRGQGRTSALHALALPEQAWMVDAPPAAGACRPLVAGGPTDARASIDLLDVGELHVAPPAPLREAALVLPPRALPPVAFFAVDGVVYDADAPEELPYLAGGDYAVRADGVEAGPVRGSVAGAAPVWLEHHEVVDGRLHVRWGGAADARVVIARDVGSQTLGVECQGVDGQLELPLETLTELGAGPASLTVNRVRRAPLGVEGFAHADLLFVARDGRDIVIPELEDGPR